MAAESLTLTSRTSKYGIDEARLKILQATIDCKSDRLPKEFEDLARLLPRLAIHFEGTVFERLKQERGWLASFDSVTKQDSKDASQDATERFLEDGPAFVATLATYTDLVLLESQLAQLIGLDAGYVLLLSILRDRMKAQDEPSLPPVEGEVTTAEETSSSSFDPAMEAMLFDQADDAELKSRTEHRLESLKRLQTKAARLAGVYAPVLVYECIAEFLLLTEFKDNELVDDHIGLAVWQACLARMAEIKYHLYSSKLCPWEDYRNKLKEFVGRVGCAKVFEGPEENLAELRHFYSTTIGHLAKLQEQYMRREREVQSLCHYIQALRWRYILEHLPLPGSHQQAGPRWESFWKQAMEEEWRQNCRRRTHPLHGIVEARNPGRRDKKKGEINTEGIKGFLFGTGSQLYNTLSDEIHHCRNGKFEHGEPDRQRDVDNCGWTQVVREIMAALEPVNVDLASGEVNWGEERKRYLP